MDSIVVGIGMICVLAFVFWIGLLHIASEEQWTRQKDQAQAQKAIQILVKLSIELYTCGPLSEPSIPLWREVFESLHLRAAEVLVDERPIMRQVALVSLQNDLEIMRKIINALRQRNCQVPPV